MNGQYIITPDGNFISEDELYHHGIKGMKWGVRRYQNSDGSLTAAGRKRYSNPDGTLNERGKKYYAQQEARLKKERQAIMAQKRLDAKLGKLDAQRKANEELRKSNPNKTSTDDDSTNKNVQKRENPSEMSDNELQNRVNRLRNEDAYRDLSKKLGYDGPKTEMDYKIEELEKQKKYLELQRDIKNLTPKKVSKGEEFAKKMLDGVLVPVAKELGTKYVQELIKSKGTEMANKLASEAAKEKAKLDRKVAKQNEKDAAKQAKKEAKEAAKAEAKQAKKEAKDSADKAQKEADAKRQAEYDKEMYEKYNKSYSDPTYGGANSSGSYRSSGGERTTVDSNRSYGMTAYKPSIGYYDSAAANKYKSDNAKTVTGTVEGKGNSSTKKSKGYSSWFGSSSKSSSNSGSSKVVFDSDNVSRGSDGVYRYNDTSTTSMTTTKNTSSGSSYVNRYSNVPIAGLLPAPKDDD